MLKASIHRLEIRRSENGNKDVVSSQINHSIVGKKNIGICLGKGVSPSEIVAGSMVYYYSSEQIY